MMVDQYDGSLIRDGTISGNLETNNNITGELIDESLDITGTLVDVSVIEYVPDHYEGSYEVTPKTTDQSLETKEKYMEDDVTVFAIPYFETSNEFGLTVYIGGE